MIGIGFCPVGNIVINCFYNAHLSFDVILTYVPHNSKIDVDTHAVL